MRHQLFRTAALVAVAMLIGVRLGMRPRPGAMFVPTAGAIEEVQGFAPKQEEEHAQVYRTGRVSARAAQVWLMLDRPLDMPFGQETALSDVLKYVQSETVGPGLPAGLPIYVDPAGLLEAEKTLESSVMLSLIDIPLATTLKLLLKQLDLTYYVRPDGLVVITYVESSDMGFDDPQALADEIMSLRQDIATLRAELRGRRPNGNLPTARFRVQPRAEPRGFE